MEISSTKVVEILFEFTTTVGFIIYLFR